MSENSDTTRRTLRWFGLGSGLVVRGSDRLEALARVLVVRPVLAPTPTPLAAATAIHTRIDTVAAAEAAGRHQVTATLLADAPTGRDVITAGAKSTVTWTGPSGAAHVGV